MGKGTRQSRKTLEKTRDIDEYNVVDPIVRYDPELVKNSLTQKFEYKIDSIWYKYEKSRRGLIAVLGAWICLYLLFYYIINIVLVQLGRNGMCNNTTPVTEPGATPSNITEGTTVLDINKLSLYELTRFFEGSSFATFLKEWKHTEKRILVTFFLGFYVSFLLARWWQQVSSIPKLDKLLSCVHANITFARSNEDNDENLKQEKAIKRRVARYCLLGITLRLSAISDQVRSQFSCAEDYIRKGLITSDEYDKMTEDGSFKKTPNMTIDGLASKWFVPLNWAALIARDVGMDVHNKVLNEHKAIVKEIADIQHKMIQITHFLHYRMSPTMHQAITLAIFVYFGCGLFASQGTFTCEEILQSSANTGGIAGSVFTALIMNFPFFQVMKYLLLLTWFQVAKDVAQPFGHDRLDLDLIAFLDVEIWKASTLFASMKIPED